MGLLKKIPLGLAELAMVRQRAEQLRDGVLRSRGHALLPIMLASFIFDALNTSSMYLFFFFFFLNKTSSLRFDRIKIIRVYVIRIEDEGYLLSDKKELMIK